MTEETTIKVTLTRKQADFLICQCELHKQLIGAQLHKTTARTEEKQLQSLAQTYHGIQERIYAALLTEE